MMSRPTSKVILIASLLPLGAVVASCGAPDQPATPVARGSFPPATRQESSAPVDLIGSYMMGGRTDAQINFEVESMISKCMAERGFPYDRPTARAAAPLTQDELVRYRIEQGDFGGLDAPVAAVDSNGARIAALPPDEQAAYLDALEGSDRLEFGEEGRPAGTRSDGCRDAAEEQLSSIVPVLSTNAPERYTRASEWLQAQPGVNEANEAFAQCMSSAGYSAVIASNIAPAPEERLSAADVAARSRADLDCQASTLWPLYADLQDDFLKFVNE